MYKKNNHLQEYLSNTKKIYDDNVFQIIKKRIFTENNYERNIYFTNLISNIKYLDDEHCSTFRNAIIKMLVRTKLYDIKKDIVQFIERFTQKKLTFFNLGQNVYNEDNIKYREKLSEDGKYIYTYYTIKNLQGEIISSYYMNKTGIKNGLSDQYKIYKMKQLAEQNPEFKVWKEIAELNSQMYSLESLNKKRHYKNLKDYNEDFDACKEVAKDLGWI
jgi:hypothetical protein